jgi:recombination protein RecR
MNSISKLARLFEQFPGIGPRQAKRFVYFLLTRNPAFINELSTLITELKQEIMLCASCFRFFAADRAGSTLCPMCRDKHRDRSTLAIVSTDADLETIEKSHSFNGLYFVLGGSVPILESEPEKRVRTRELMETLEPRAKSGELKEIILATSLNLEGEHTADFVRSLLSPFIEKYGLKISTLGRGLSTGTELEYSDADTIKNALKNRTI